jgi:hypothetical protein
MDTTAAQTILALTQQNLKLMEELASVRAELTKYQTAQVVELAPGSKAKKTTVKKEVDPNKPKNPARVETGKRVALWNANRKSMRTAFDEWRKSIADQE